MFAGLNRCKRNFGQRIMQRSNHYDIDFWQSQQFAPIGEHFRTAVARKRIGPRLTHICAGK
jgi:hypothetical protein